MSSRTLSHYIAGEWVNLIVMYVFVNDTENTRGNNIKFFILLGSVLARRRKVVS
jgi:hypothetical protein